MPAISNDQFLYSFPSNSIGVILTILFLLTYTLTGIEAMLFECPVVCSVLDGEERFRIYEDAVDYVDRIEDLEELLDKLATSCDFRQRWHEQHMDRQKAFLTDYFCNMDKPPSVRQDEILDRYLEEHMVTYVPGSSK